MIDKKAVFLLTMFPQRLAMIAGKDDQRAVVKPALFQISDYPSEFVVGICDLTVIRRICKSCPEGLRRIISAMRIVQMQPQEEWFDARAAQPFQSFIDAPAGLAFHKPGIVFQKAAAFKYVVVQLETPIEPPTSVEHVR